MTTLTQTASSAQHPGWFSKTEHWLDSKGKGAWIAVLVLSLIIFWPVGLAVLAYLIWSKRMFNFSCNRASHNLERGPVEMRKTGNSAFDAYKADTLRRLEEEQDKFEAFLERLRDAKDKAEFDQFMQERAAKSQDSATET
ncbi:MAG: DUF2852 domain-containing protein [Roseobacter sp.]